MQKKYSLFFISIILTLIFLPQIIWAQTAVLSFSPSSGTFAEGQSFWINIMVDTKGTAVNAVAAYIFYPQDKLTPLGVNTSGSVMTIWAEQTAANGKVQIAGGLPSPGFSGVKKIASIGFRVKTSSGSVNLKFDQDSAVLSNATNQNILNLSSSGQGNYNLAAKPAVPAVPTAPVKSEIQKPLISEVEIREISQNEVTISWKTDIDSDSLIEYGLTGDTIFLSIADETLTKEHLLKLSELSPGTIYYFKVKSKTVQGGEGSTDAFSFGTQGYQAEIMVFDSETNQVLSGAEVTSVLPEEVTKVTDEKGKVVFNNLPLGEQWISVKYKGVSLSYQIDVMNQEAQVFKIGFKMPPPKKAEINIFWIVSIFVLLALIIVVVWIIVKEWILKRKPETPQNIP